MIYGAQFSCSLCCHFCSWIFIASQSCAQPSVCLAALLPLPVGASAPRPGEGSGGCHPGVGGFGLLLVGGIGETFLVRVGAGRRWSWVVSVGSVGQAPPAPPGSVSLLCCYLSRQTGFGARRVLCVDAAVLLSRPTLASSVAVSCCVAGAAGRFVLLREEQGSWALSFEVSGMAVRNESSSWILLGLVRKWTAVAITGISAECVLLQGLCFSLQQSALMGG